MSLPNDATGQTGKPKQELIKIQKTICYQNVNKLEHRLMELYIFVSFICPIFIFVSFGFSITVSNLKIWQTPVLYEI